MCKSHISHFCYIVSTSATLAYSCVIRLFFQYYVTPWYIFFRYRIIVSVTIGQKRQQSVHVFHSFLWDHNRDSFAAHTFENCHIYANVVVYGVYLD